MAFNRKQLLIKRPEWSRLYERVTYETKKEFYKLWNFHPFDFQEEILAYPARFKNVTAGRRVGKTTGILAPEFVVMSAMGGGCLLVGPDMDKAGLAFGHVLEIFLDSDLKSLVHSVNEASGKMGMQLKSGGFIKVKSTAEDIGLRGRGLDFIGFTEAAWEPNRDRWYSSLRPSLSDRLGGALWESSPRGRNWHKDTFDRGQSDDPKHANTKSWQIPSARNPRLPREEIEEAKNELDDATFRQEYLAEFLDDTGAVFHGYHLVSDQTFIDGPEDGHIYVLGIDVARYEDWTVISCFDLNRRAFVWADRFNMIDWKSNRERAKAASVLWNHAPICIDITGGYETNAEELEAICQAPIIPFNFTELSKKQLINSYKLAIERKEIHLLDRQTPIGKVSYEEHGSYAIVRTASGHIKMGAPSGRHDDLVCANALAYRIAGSYTGFIAEPKAQEQDRSPLQGTFVELPTAGKQRKMKGRFSR